ncbi:nucleoside-diphosphate-sugar epimerase [Grosmannia clavigera kw1407]|uniref:Nucleoside-diphosphate-sugar epimerase n=1 Tax=Grosmannia clavigera (strain kw1407 / UAMH 11150) TaxID=655863 RepID=F0XQX6_GROCL|nr:nucleoside-diphosphate-sugar epimerase [Grosmannia clavigera kw1407]EFW99885.1 nucleoside-diphosphate-sugar epimerase [Grosmannia clavigera kw1407]
MGKYVLSGVDGQLGSVAAQHVLALASPTDKLVFTSPVVERIPPEIAKEWKDKGIEIQYASYDDPASMEKAFENADTVSLISTWMIGDIRRKQHRQAVAAAKAAGAKRICYTSYIGAGTAENTPLVASDHRDTEEAIVESGIPYNIQRNNFYLDNYFRTLFPMAQNVCGGKWHWNSNGTPASFVAKADCSRVVAALLLGKGEPNTIYNVTGPEMVSDYTFIDMVRKYTGWKGELVASTDEELYEYWGGRGVPKTVTGDFSKSPIPLCVDDIVTNTTEIRNGTMGVVSDAVEKLTGRKPSSSRDVMLLYKDVLPKA